MRGFFLAVIGIVSALVASGAIAQERTTVCDLSQHPRNHVSHRVAVFGEIRGGLDRLLLVDHSCGGEPIEISISNSVAEHADVAPLSSAIYRTGNIGTVGKLITATVIGTYSYKRDDWPGGVLSVERVQDLHMKYLPVEK